MRQAGEQEREEASGPAAQSNGGAKAPAAPSLLSVSVSMGAARRVLLSYTWYHSKAAPRGKARPPAACEQANQEGAARAHLRERCLVHFCHI